MEIYQLVRRGEIHKDFCEDFLLAYQLNQRYSIYGVFDGCSTGTDSHLASALLAKTVRAELQYIVNEPVESLKSTLADTVYNTISTLRNIRNDLMLETSELLSTMILFLVDNDENAGEILVFGDGFVAINGSKHHIDQDNTPDYLAYYLDQLEDIDDFDSWLNQHATSFSIAAIEDVSISTDGINSFKRTKSLNEIQEEINPVEYLANDGFLVHNKSMLARKLNILRTKHLFINQDDIAMIRIIT